MAHTILCYGKTRTSKTSQFRFIAEKVWRESGQRSRFVTSDTGSLWSPIQDLVDADIVRPLLVPVDPAFNPLPVMRKLRRGEWPKERDEKGIAFIRRAADTTKTIWQTPTQQVDFSEIGAYAFESLTSFGEGAMRDLREKKITVGQGDVPGFRTEDGEAFAANTQNHYSMSHNEILDLLNAVSVLPVKYVYMTALEGMGTDDDGPLTKAVLGPKVPGKAITEIIPSRVNDCLHLTFEKTADGKGEELRCYIRPHPSEVASKNWPAGLRSIATPVVLKAVQEKFPNGYFPLSIEKGIGELLEFQDQMKLKAAEAIEKLKASVMTKANDQPKEGA